MKIGLIGNMNNNNFALMRYFRDLGVDAHLLLYSNDGEGTLSHFVPEADTWEIQRWASYIHQTSMPNDYISAFDFPFSLAMGFRSLVRFHLRQIDQRHSSVSRSEILRAYSGYTFLVGSGVSPALLARVGYKLNIFYPYSIGVEFLGDSAWCHGLLSKPFLSRSFMKYASQKQLRGIKLASHVMVGDGYTKQMLDKLGVRSHLMAYPMVYNAEVIPDSPVSSSLQGIQATLLRSKLVVLHHSRLMWTKPDTYSELEWKRASKNNHWFFKSLARLVRDVPRLDVQALVCHYGPDVKPTKRLIADLGIQDYVTWLPLLSRKEILWLLSKVSLSIGEFYDMPHMLWGGAGWEALAVGTPLIQGFNYTDYEFSSMYSMPPPPILPVSTEDHIYLHLLRAASGAYDLPRIRKESIDWFNTYNGIGLASQWLSLLS